jgi:hypothetical protein
MMLARNMPSLEVETEAIQICVCEQDLCARSFREEQKHGRKPLMLRL